jgi:Chaperone of endosialidase
MFGIRFFHVFYLFLSWSLVTGLSPISAQSQNIPINLFDRDINLIVQNSHESYEYVDKELNIEALEYIQSFLHTHRAQLNDILAEKLIDDLENNLQNTITRAPNVCDFVTPTQVCTLVVNKDLDVLGQSNFHQHVKTKQGIHVLGKLKVGKKATFKNNVTIDGTLSVGSLSVGDVILDDVTINGSLTISSLTSPGILHNNASGNITSSLVVDADIATGTITNDKLANISSADIPGDIVVRDGSGDFATHMITIDGTPINPTDVATVAYVNASVVPLNPKTPAVAVSVSNEVLNGFPTIDGVTFPTGTNRVLLTGQTNELENGLWVVAAGAWSRPVDFATGTEAGSAYVLILEGAVYAGSSWLCNTPNAVIGTDPIMFVLFSLVSSVTGANEGTGTGLVFDDTIGNTLYFRSLNAADAYMSIITSGENIDISTNATSADVASTIVARDVSGDFAAGIITTPGLSSTSSLSFSTNSTEQLNISSSGTISINAFTTAGVVHNDNVGDLSSSLIVNADVDPNAAIIDTKLATLVTPGKVANSATTATSSNTPSTIVLRDTNGNFSANAVSFNDAVIQTLVIASVIDNVTVAELSATDIVVSGNLSANDEVINGTLQMTALTPAGVLHNDASGNITSSLIVNADIAANANIANGKLATLTTPGLVANSATTATNLNTANAIVARDSSGNFSAGTITATLNGNATTATTTTNFSGSLSGDVTGTQSATVVSFVGGQTAANVAAATIEVDAATNLNTANTLVKRDGTGSFAAQEISMNDGILAGDLILSIATSTATTGNIIKGSNRFIHNFGTNNTFVGLDAGNFTTSGPGSNSALGVNALTANGTGAFNVAVGYQTLGANSIGVDNTAVGYNALAVNTTGTDNTAIGYNALVANATGTSFNTAVGSSTLTANTTGAHNTAIGYQALLTNITGSNNIALGYQAGNILTTGSGNIYINAPAGSASESSTTRIGTSQTSCFIAGINGTGISGDAVSINSNGQLGITFSSQRFKHNIEDMGDFSENVLKLRPVTFVYNNDELDTQEIGLIAEEVDELFPAMVAKDKDGIPYTVRYHLLPVLLLNELQKQHTIITQQQVAIEDMNNAIAQLKAEMRKYIAQTVA